MNMEVLIHSILISEVKVTKTHVLQELEKFQTKITLKSHFEFNFNNFQKRKNGKVLG